MKRALLGKAFTLGVLVGASVLCGAPGTALADDPYGLAPGHAPSSGSIATWGSGRTGSLADATSVARDAPVTRAREMLTRARFLDDAAAVDEKAATELATKLVTLRAAAKTARDRVEKAAPEEREVLGARAEDLEADVIVSEAEIGFKRRTAADNRRVARELRLRAVKLVREAPLTDDTPAASSCDPPFRYTADGRKIYRVECLK